MLHALERYELYKAFPGWSFRTLCETPAWEVECQLDITREVQRQRDDPGAQMRREVAAAGFGGAPPSGRERLPPDHPYASVMPPEATLTVPDAWPEHVRAATMLTELQRRGVVQTREAQSTTAEQETTA